MHNSEPRLDDAGFTVSVADGILINEILHDILDAAEQLGITGQVEFIDLNGYARKKLADGDRIAVKAVNHPENGLLLRSDIHTLFDLDLLGIEPDRLQVELHPSLRPEYGDLAGLQLGCRSGLRPSSEALSRRYKLFLKKLDAPA